MTELILGIESSCDETAAAVVRGAREVLSSVVHSQIDEHAVYGGVGPEIAGRSHLRKILPVIDGALEHRDSMGFRDRLGPGDAQWIRAGRGILHAEQPQGGRHGLQLWTSLPPAEKFAEPAYASWRAADIPLLERPGARVRVVAGSIEGATGPMVLATPTVFAHVQLDAAAALTLDVDPAADLCLYVLDGELAGAKAPLGAGTLAILTPGTRVALAATADGPVNMALLGGAPVEGPFLFAGPFVMDTQERLARAERDYASGRMGRLEGVPF